MMPLQVFNAVFIGLVLVLILFATRYLNRADHDRETERATEGLAFRDLFIPPIPPAKEYGAQGRRDRRIGIVLWICAVLVLIAWAFLGSVFY